MPRTTREWSQRKLKESKNCLGWAITHLEDMRKVYAEPHPEIAQILEQIQATIILSDDLIDKLSKTY